MWQRESGHTAGKWPHAAAAAEAVEAAVEAVGVGMAAVSGSLRDTLSDEQGGAALLTAASRRSTPLALPSLRRHYARGPAPRLTATVVIGRGLTPVKSLFRLQLQKFVPGIIPQPLARILTTV
jgi:hypothetical protein